jgi:D-amino peptidase
MFWHRLGTTALCLGIVTFASATVTSVAHAQQRPLRIFISVDMEGIGGIGTPNMTSRTGKDYTLGRQFMTAEVNAVVAAIFQHGPAEVLVNDSHGDMQNLNHEQLDQRVTYIQGNIKPLGMVQGLDESFDAVIFLGYHARAGTPDAFLAHTGSGSVKGLWINGTEVGEGGLNAYFAGAIGVPVILASGDSAFAQQIGQRIDAVTIVTKTAVGSLVARLDHPAVVRTRLREATLAALARLPQAQPLVADEPITIGMRFATTTRPGILLAIPGMRRIDGYTVEYQADTMNQAYQMVRLMYKYISW